MSIDVFDSFSSFDIQTFLLFACLFFSVRMDSVRRERFVEGTLLAGRNLVAKDQEVYGDNSDPYAILWIGSRDGFEAADKAERVVSEVVFESLNPQWNFPFSFHVADGDAVLHIRLMDYDANKPHDYMGTDSSSSSSLALLSFFFLSFLVASLFSFSLHSF